MTGWANGLAMDFGSQGLWSFDGANWTPISSGDVETMTGWASGLAMDFGSSGLWNFDGTNWSQISSADTDDLTDVDLY